MGMNPDAAHLFRPPPGVHLTIEKVGHRMVVEADRDARTDLADELDIFDVE
jgi:hypothetical protein